MRHATLTVLSTISILSATVINVPGDYTTIQAGINASVEGDTVLVAQGNYVENLILEKEIVLASHAIYDDLDSEWFNNDHISSTRIMGGNPSNSKKGSCIQVSYGNIQPTILGFTISQGLGTSVMVEDCGITRIERSGGAIIAFQAYPVIAHNKFMNNGVSMFDEDNAVQAIQNGGAITLYDDDDVEFDEDRDNSGRTTTDSRDVPDTWNVQNNYFENNSSGNGENFYAQGYTGTIDVSGSVFEDIDCEQGTVNEFVLHSVEEEALYLTNDISGACLDQNTFFVDPVSGDDQNSGMEEEPFRSIRHALTMIRKGDDNTTVVNLSAGEYSFETNGEIFPIVLPDNVHLIGDERETTILDANANQNEEAGVMIIPECENVKVANMTLRNAYAESHGCSGGGALLVTADDTKDLTWDTRINKAIIENLILENSHSKNGGGLSLFRVDGPTVTDVIVRNNTATMMGGGINVYSSNVSMEDVEIHDNLCYGTVYNGYNDVGHGGGLFMNQVSGTLDKMYVHNNTASMNGGGVWSSEGSDWIMTNSTVSDNVAPYMGGGFGFWNHNGGGGLNATLQNVTIENNVAQSGWGIGHGGGVWANNSSTVFEDCSFINNVSNDNGGAVNYWGGSSSPKFYGTTFDGNSATSNGGAIYIAPDAAGFHVEYCTFVNNSTSNGNGAAIQTNHPGTVINSTFYGNTVNGDAGTLGIGDYVFVDVYNSIFWNEGVEYEISGYASYATLHHSLVQPMGNDGYDGLWNTWGFGNIDVDPLLTDPSEGDYTLTADSPCKDAGIADLDGDGIEDITEYNGSAPDMGAYEIVLAAPSGLTIYPMETYVSLTWDPTTDEGFQYYLLERSTDVEFVENVVSNYVTINYYEDSSLEYDTEYFYRISFFNGSWSEVSDPVSISLEFMSVDGDQLPNVFALHQNYPNPFNPVTNLSYDLPEDALVNITIYDMMGKVVSTLVNAQQSAGFKTLQWNATNYSGMPISAGLYIYTIQAGEFNQTRKMILLK